MHFLTGYRSAEILKIMLSDEVLDADVDLAALAKRTDSFSGSDLKRVSVCCQSCGYLLTTYPIRFVCSRCAGCRQGGGQPSVEDNDQTENH